MCIVRSILWVMFLIFIPEYCHQIFLEIPIFLLERNVRFQNADNVRFKILQCLPWLKRCFTFAMLFQSLSTIIILFLYVHRTNQSGNFPYNKLPRNIIVQLLVQFFFRTPFQNWIWIPQKEVFYTWQKGCYSKSSRYDQ